MKIPELKKEKIQCSYCSKLLVKNSPNHAFHKKCIQELQKWKFDTLENTTEKATWKYKKPDTISRSAVYRRNLKQK